MNNQTTERVPNFPARLLDGRRLAFGAVGLAVIGGLGCLIARQGVNSPASQSAAASGAPAILMDIVHTVRRDAPSQIVLTGQIEPEQTATISAEVNDRILSRPIRQGDRVVQGGMIALLDTRTAETTLAQARAAEAQIVAAIQQTETDYARAEVETDAARMQARAQFEQATAGSRQAQAQAQGADASLRKAKSYTRTQELRQAEAALAQAKTDENLARIEADRYRRLVQQGAVAQQTLDHALATYDSAVARRQSAEESVSLAREGARQEDIAAAQAQLEAANAQQSSAVAQIETARANVRIADTRGNKLASIRRQIDSLRAQRDQAHEAAVRAQIALDKHRIVAPFTGRILAAMVDAGDLLSAGSPVARIGRIDRVKATFSVPEAARPMLRKGQMLALSIDALPGRTVSGRITALGFQADARSRAFPLEVSIENPDETLLANMVVRARLPIGKASGRMLIPSSAVAIDGSQPYLFVVREGKAQRVDVQLGEPVGSRVEITPPLAETESVAATPQRLTDGCAVQTPVVR